jgi:hypothetical protein
MLLGLSSCLASSVVDPDARAVHTEALALEWRSASAADLQGLFESRSIDGEAGASLWKLYYHFSADGTYSGAALVFDGSHAAFQTLSGMWSLADGRLELDSLVPAQAWVADDFMRLESEEGAALLERVPID